jgi:hypothetical protein
VQVVDKPAALNFQGALEVQNASGVANIRLPDAITAPGQIRTFTEGQYSSGISIDATETQIYPETGADSFTAIVAGTHRVDMMLPLVGNGVDYNTTQFRVVFDEGLSTEVSIGYAEQWRSRGNNSQYQPQTFFGNVELAAKTYTLNAYGQRIDGTGTSQVVGSASSQAGVTVLVTAVTGSGAGGEFIEDAEATGAEVSLTKDVEGVISTDDITISGDDAVQVDFTGFAKKADSNIQTTLHVRLYANDTLVGPDPLILLKPETSTTAVRENISFSRRVTGLGAGTHTIEVRGITLSGGGGNDYDVYPTTFQLSVARGGLVPITDGFTTVDKPTSQKFVNASVTDNAGQAVVALPEAVTVPGVLIETNNINFAAGDSVSSTTFSRIDDGASGDAFFTIDVPTAGLYHVALIQTWFPGGAAPGHADFRLNFDSGDQYVGAATSGTVTKATPDDWTWRGRMPGNTERRQVDGVGQVELTAGSHTIEVEWARYDGTDAPSVNEHDTCKVVLQSVTGSGAAGNLLGEDTTTSNNTVTSNTPVVLPTDPLSVSFESSNENVTLHFNGLTANTSGGATTVIVIFMLDGSDVGTHQMIIPTASWYESVSFSVPVAVTAGSHTAEIWGYTGAGQQFRVQAGAKLWVMQDRGGLVPIKNDGALVQDKPHSINLLGPGLQGTNVNGAVHVSVNSAAEGATYTTASGTGGQTISTTQPTYTSVASVFVTIAENEEVDLTYRAQCRGNGASQMNFQIYNVTDAEAIATGLEYSLNSTDQKDVTISGLLSGKPAGTYEIAARSTIWSGATFNLNQSHLTAKQFKGGFVVPENVPQLAYNSASVVDVSPKAGTSSRLWLLLSDGIRYYADGTQTIDLTTTGLGGLDTGTEAVSTWYYCYAVPSATTWVFDVVASVTGPATGPTGYSSWKYLGAVYNDSAGDLRKWIQTGNNRFEYPGYVEGAASQALAGSTLYSKMDLDLSDVIPETATSMNFFAVLRHGTSAGWSPQMLLYVKNEANWHTYMLCSYNPYESNASEGFIPISVTQTIEYQSTSDGAGSSLYSQDVFTRGWIDGWLASDNSPAQTAYDPDTPPPKGTWIDVTEVDFAAWPGHGSTLRLALSDGKTRIASGTLAVDKNNGVADLGYDDASSQGNSKWLYFYAVPKTGDDDLFTIVMSDNEPATGPLGRSSSKYLWSTYIDGGGELLEVIQTSPGRFANVFRSISHDGIGGVTDAVEDLTAYAPKTASALDLSVFFGDGGGSDWQSVTFKRESGGPTFGYVYSWSCQLTDRFLLPLGYDGSGNPRFYYTTGGGSLPIQFCRWWIFGWVDEYLAADAGIGVAVGGGGTSSPLTTKGDVYTYDTDNQRLGVGSNGQVLTADSAEATGIKWATPSTATSYLREESFSTTTGDLAGSTKSHVIATTPNTAGTTSGYDVLVYRNGLKMKNVATLTGAYDEFTFTVGTLTVAVTASGAADDYDVDFRS